MKSLETCTLVMEYNYSPPRDPDRGSVWLRAGDGSTDLESSSALGELPGWYRVVGPIDYNEAAAIHAKLKEFLTSTGVMVIDEGVAD